jgi:drug/metabolite transporter (DMT)-like permease
MNDRQGIKGYAAALASAAFVGLFTVINKWLLREDLPALTAAAWTYGAAALALAPFAIWKRGFRVRRGFVMAAWLFAGSVAGPGLYFLGLKLTSGVQGVLMINLEAVFTAFLAFIFFKERLTVITVLAGIAVLVGGIWVSWPVVGGKLLAGQTLGDLLMALGYIGWATENNLGRLLGEEIPAVTLVCVKALVASAAMVILAGMSGSPLAVPARLIPGIFASGAVSLGLSLAFFYFAMQQIGAARAGLIASTSSLWGTIAAIVLLKDSVTASIVGGGVLMIAGLLCFGWETAKPTPNHA